MKRTSVVGSIALLCVLALSLLASGSVDATGSTTSRAKDINDFGQVVGQRYFVPSVGHAFLWESGAFRDLGTLASLGGPSEALGINNDGQVVGQSFDTTGAVHHAFLWPNPDTGSGMKDLGTLGGASSAAWDVNNAGQIVGESETASGAKHAFLWTSGIMTDLGVLPGTGANAYSFAWGINAIGQISGHALSLSGGAHAVVWKPQADGSFSMTDLGTLSGGTSFGRGINDGGSIVGYASVALKGATPINHAVLWTPRTDGSYSVTDIGSLGGPTAVGLDINEARQVVGWGNLKSKGTLTEHAFLWTAGTGLVDLGTVSGACCSAGLAVNEAGTIAGWSKFSSGTYHAVLWINRASTDLEA
jgi:probable HAF family extracellular repeat protein